MADFATMAARSDAIARLSARSGVVRRILANAEAQNQHSTMAAASDELAMIDAAIAAIFNGK